jgi:transcriptional regulator with XRE-family HTH domain
MTKDRARAIQVEFAKQFHALRTERELSIYRVAKDLGTDRRQISLYDTGQGTPSLAMLVEISEYFGVTLDELVGRNSKKDEA